MFIPSTLRDTNWSKTTPCSSRVTSCTTPTSFAICSPTQPQMLPSSIDIARGWTAQSVTISADDTIQEFIPKKNIDQTAYDRYYKTVNIYKFSKEYLRGSYLPFLEAYVHSVGTNEYYEQVLGVIASLDKEHLAAMPLAGQRWYEIDDPQDYQIAQTLFAPPELQYSSFVNWYGGYWRFPELRDFCYLVNPYFPPAAMRDEMQRSFEVLLRGYPSSSKVQSQLAAKMFGVDAAHIAVGNGAAELICALGDEIKVHRVGVPLPTFEEYLKRFPEAEIVEYTNGNADFEPNLLQLKAVIEEADALVLVNPDTPSGQCLPAADLSISFGTWRRKTNTSSLTSPSWTSQIRRFAHQCCGRTCWTTIRT